MRTPILDGRGRIASSAVLRRDSRARWPRKTIDLSRQAELVSDALVAANMVELMNEIIASSQAVVTADPSLIDSGIDLAAELQEGGVYLAQHRESLMHRPESADTAEFMMAHGVSNIRGDSERARSILTEIKAGSTSGGRVSTERVEFIRDYFRAVQSSIMDQLEASGDPNEWIPRISE